MRLFDSINRWKQCVSLVNEGFGLVAAHLYVTKMAANWTNTWVRCCSCFSQYSVDVMLDYKSDECVCRYCA